MPEDSLETPDPLVPTDPGVARFLQKLGKVIPPEALASAPEGFDAGDNLGTPGEETADSEIAPESEETADSEIAPESEEAEGEEAEEKTSPSAPSPKKSGKPSPTNNTREAQGQSESIQFLQEQREVYQAAIEQGARTQEVSLRRAEARIDYELKKTLPPQIVKRDRESAPEELPFANQPALEQNSAAENAPSPLVAAQVDETLIQMRVKADLLRELEEETYKRERRQKKEFQIMIEQKLLEFLNS